MIASAFDELDYDYAASVAQKALQGMAAQHVPATPDNFSVWFVYSMGVPSDLQRAVDILIGNKRKFDATVNRDLFSTYVAAPDGSAAALASQQLHAVMDAAQVFLATAIADNHAQIRAIHDVADQGQAGSDPMLLVQQLMNELAKAAGRAANLEAGFAEKTQELESIRETLNKSEERARTDTLTGLPNRRALDEFFRKAQIAAMEKGAPLSLLMLDIDHFKSFNDTFGHGVGDQVLRLMAQVLRDKVRELDLPARYGGEELIAVLPDADLAAARAIAERIRRSIAECQITRRSTGEILPSITVSIGAAQFQPGEAMNDLVERCDRALYLAKHSGRNRVVDESELDREIAAL